MKTLTVTASLVAFSIERALADSIWVYLIGGRNELLTRLGPAPRPRKRGPVRCILTLTGMEMSTGQPNL